MSIRNFPLRRSLLALALAAPSLAFAQSDDAKDLDDVVVTATRTATTVDASLAAVEVIDRSQIEAIGSLAPRDRLIQMMNSLVSPRHWTLERAMREWARSDEAVAESVRAADRRILAAVRRAFEDYGFDADEAELRADATFAVGIGFLHLSGDSPHPRLAARSERFLDLMLAT